MNFRVDDDVAALVASLEHFFERRGDARAIAGAAGTSAPADRRRWVALCEMGLPALRLPTPAGIGAGLLEATAVAEKIGAVLLPEPAVGAVVLAQAVANCPEPSDMLDTLCDGYRVIALCGLQTVKMSGAGELSGQVRVPDDNVTDAVAFLADDESAVVVVNTADLPTPTSRTDVDPTRPSAVVELTAVEPTDVLRIDTPVAGSIRRELALLMTAELVGGMQKVLTDTIEYVTAREQFGTAIGSFQTVKHRLADMYVATEQARAAVQLAALECAGAIETAAWAVASAARWVPRAAIDLFEDAIHLHGAMGYSWEVDVHLHLRRALAARAALSGSKLAAVQPFSPVTEAV